MLLTSSLNTTQNIVIIVLLLFLMQPLIIAYCSKFYDWWKERVKNKKVK
jgi:hypothetical protein